MDQENNMKYYSIEATRQHNADLETELRVKRIEETLRYFIVNKNGNKTTLPMYDLAFKQARGWSATGLLDLHDLAQECYCALVKAHNRVNWKAIEASTIPRASLWAYLNKSIKFDVRKAINTYKDGMNIPLNKIWEARDSNQKFELDNFFSVPVDGWWLYINDEVLNMVDDSKMSQWETEELYNSLEHVMTNDLSKTEQLVLEMSYGIDQPNEDKRSIKYIAKYFSLSERGIKKIKARALKKLSSEENKEYLREFIEN